MSNGHWVCFKAQKANIYGYAKLQLDLSAPTITLTQDNNTISATGTGLSGYKYFTSSSDPTCNSTGTYSQTGTTTTAMTDDHWVCFKAKNSKGIYGYAEKQIDLTAPAITLTQNNNTITASGTGLTDFGYFVSSSNPTCGSSGSYTAGSTTSVMTDKQQACFKAKNSKGVYGYAKLEINLTQHPIAVKQTATNVQAIVANKFSLGSTDKFRTSTVDGDWLAIGAAGDTGHSGAGTGAVYIFKLENGVWGFQAEVGRQVQWLYKSRTVGSIWVSVCL